MTLFAADAAPEWGWIALGVLAIPLLVALNGFFVAAEFALVAVRATRIEELVKQGNPRAKAAEAAVTNLDQSIAATQLGITLASIALGWVGESVMEHLLRPVVAFLPDHVAFLSRHAISITIAFSFVTFLHVVFGELIPKAIALQVPDTTALRVAGPLNLFAKLSRPVVYVMNGTANWLVRRLGYQPSGEAGEVHSIEELRMIIEDTEEAGLLDSDQADVLMNVFGLSNKKVQDVMVPREKVAALELSMTPEQVMEAVRQGAHTRMPVYDRDWEHLVGVVNTKDLFYLFSLKGMVVLEDAVYAPLFLYQDATVADALKEFKRTHKHLAVVRGEDQMPVGILTLEDVLEEIVGDIEDEHDVPVPKLRRTAVQKLIRRRRRDR